jgi:hypothetical protein
MRSSKDPSQIPIDTPPRVTNPFDAAFGTEVIL